MEPKTNKKGECLCALVIYLCIYIYIFSSFWVCVGFVFVVAFSLLRDDVKITAPGLLIVLNGVSSFTQNSGGELYTYFSPPSSLRSFSSSPSLPSYTQLLLSFFLTLDRSASPSFGWGGVFPSLPSNVTLLVPSRTKSVLLISPLHLS